MKFILVVYLCIAGACESVYEQKLYDTRQECESASVEIMDYAQKRFPNSSGQIWCLTEPEFKQYQDFYDITQDT